MGVVQGLSEFLPVSSSAHLVFAEKILGPVNNDVAFLNAAEKAFTNISEEI